MHIISTLFLAALAASTVAALTLKEAKDQCFKNPEVKEGIVACCTTEIKRVPGLRTGLPAMCMETIETSTSCAHEHLSLATDWFAQSLRRTWMMQRRRVQQTCQQASKQASKQ
jgi:hypothetical protein